MSSQRYIVACLDVWAPEVQAIVAQTAPAEFECRFAASYDPEEQARLAQDADFWLVGWAPVSAELLGRARKLRMVHKWGVGIDRIDVEEMRRQGIPLAITAGANAAPVAELAIALMLAVYRRIPMLDRSLREGRWLKAEVRAFSMQIGGKTVGLLGFGNIGRMVARKLTGFGPRIIYYDEVRAPEAVERDHGVEFRSFDEVLKESDILSLHMPWTESTHGIIGRDAIGRMKKKAILINTARGELVDEQALYDALADCRLGGAGLDAFVEEPPSKDNPLLTLDQVVATPHCGGGVIDNVANVAAHAFGNLQKFLAGERIRPADLVVPPKA